jgi:hypothetical protein
MENLIITLIGIIIYSLLSLAIPCILKKNKQSLIIKIHNFFEHGKNNLVLNSIIFGSIFYLALFICEQIDMDTMMKNIDIDMNNNLFNNNNSNIKNLAFLNELDVQRPRCNIK